MTDHVRDVFEAANRLCWHIRHGDGHEVAGELLCDAIDAFRAAGGLEAYDRERAGRTCGSDISETFRDPNDLLRSNYFYRNLEHTILNQKQSPTPQPALAVVQEIIPPNPIEKITNLDYLEGWQACAQEVAERYGQLHCEGGTITHVLTGEVVSCGTKTIDVRAWVGKDHAVPEGTDAIIIISKGERK